MSENVVFLKFSNPNLEDDQRALMSCRGCKNKTFRVVHDRVGSYPLVECAACNDHIGRLGWAPDEDGEGAA